MREADLPQLPRFGPLRAEPPAETVRSLTGAARGTTWTTTRLGNEGDYPNGGLWRVSADTRTASEPATVVVKRTGPGYLGGSAVWRNRTAPADAQWWGREAAFYRSTLATTGWTDDVRAARGHVDDHDDVADLWLEDVQGIPADITVCRRAVGGLAHWQAVHTGVDADWLSTDWIATHVGRQALDNERTLAHPGWPAAIERGLDPVLRDWIETRVTDPGEVNVALAAFPVALTNHDFHTHNIGTVDDAVVIIDWAYVGHGPIGHDVGHLALALADEVDGGLASTWTQLADAYCAGLVAAGWTGDVDLVRRSMATSTRLRMGWYVDHLLAHAEHLSDEALVSVGTNLRVLTELS